MISTDALFLDGFADVRQIIRETMRNDTESPGPPSGSSASAVLDAASETLASLGEKIRSGADVVAQRSTGIFRLSNICIIDKFVLTLIPSCCKKYCSRGNAT